MGVLREEGLDGEGTEVKIAVVMKGYVLEGLVLSLDDYAQEVCLIGEPELWSGKV